MCLAIFFRPMRVCCAGRKTMALKLRTDCGQTRGQYPAPPPEHLEKIDLIPMVSALPVPMRSAPLKAETQDAEAGAK